MKKKILFHSNHSRAFTGFGKNCKNILQYLAQTNKYEIVELANGISYSQPILKNLPWKCLGSFPDDPGRINQINRDPSLSRKAAYGSEMIDLVIKEEKPDFYIGAEDIWAFEDYTTKPWWNKINCMIWTTLDSLPILPTAVKMAPKIQNYYVWASFAEKALHALGHTHVKTLRGCIDPSTFYKLPNSTRNSLRKQNNIDEDAFIIGFVFRNQLRKSVPNLLDGFKLFLSQNPSSKAKLLLHTHWGEGWDILRLAKEKQINIQDILTTYICKHCRNYEIKPFAGPNLNCPFCGAQQTQDTTSVHLGVTEGALNEIYNLMDVYCHPFTSGGQEIPLQEAKLTELITLTTNYSCGEDNCTPESAGLPLDWTEYREPNTQFIKATTSPHSILQMLEKVFNMSVEEKKTQGVKARDFVINNFTTEVIGKQLEDIIDNATYNKWDFNFTSPPKNPDYNPPPIEDNSQWLIDIYKNILQYDADEADEGHQYWMSEFKKGAPREGILNYFKKVAHDENFKKKNKIEFKNLFDMEDEADNSPEKALMVCSGGNKDVFNSTSLLKSFKDEHPDCRIYYACHPKSIPLVSPHPLVYKCIPYSEIMDNEIAMTTSFKDKGYVDYYFNFSCTTVNQIAYLTNPNKLYSPFLCNE